MNDVIKFSLAAQNVAPTSDGLILVKCVKETIEKFGALEFALSLTEQNVVPLKIAA